MQTKNRATRYSKEFRESMVFLGQTGRSANALSKEYNGLLCQVFGQKNANTFLTSLFIKSLPLGGLGFIFSSLY